MATTHVLIVDDITLKYHLEHMFVGTGNSNKIIDFNNSENTSLHRMTEGNLIGMISDISRIRIGDYIMFYQQSGGNHEGKFFGIFKARSNSFIDNLNHCSVNIELNNRPNNFKYPKDNSKFILIDNEIKIHDVLSDIEEERILNYFENEEDKTSIRNIINEFHTENQYLLKELQKSLTFRVLIEPYIVYKKGVTEWEALDEIKNIRSPYQMLWSLIYRKLKGNRGCTMITTYESECLFSLIRNKNLNISLEGNNFTYLSSVNEINTNNNDHNYTGEQVTINILPRLKKKCTDRQAFEAHLQCFITQYIGKNVSASLDNLILNGLSIEWLGNEVSCGVGMQRIDVMLSLIQNETTKICVAIELKAVEASAGITKQVQRYIDWLDQYYIPNSPSSLIQPVIIAKRIEDKDSDSYTLLISELNALNENNPTHKDLKYIEFEIIDNNLVFSEIDY